MGAMFGRGRSRLGLLTGMGTALTILVLVAPWASATSYISLSPPYNPGCTGTSGNWVLINTGGATLNVKAPSLPLGVVNKSTVATSAANSGTSQNVEYDVMQQFQVSCFTTGSSPSDQFWANGSVTWSAFTLGCGRGGVGSSDLNVSGNFYKASGAHYALLPFASTSINTQSSGGLTCAHKSVGSTVSPFALHVGPVTLTSSTSYDFYVAFGSLTDSSAGGFAAIAEADTNWSASLSTIQCYCY